MATAKITHFIRSHYYYNMLRPYMDILKYVTVSFSNRTQIQANCPKIES
jgi:hypothetical protein